MTTTLNNYDYNNRPCATQQWQQPRHPIKFLVMDVDGTLTDGKLYVSATGEALKRFNCKDGYGIKNLLPAHSIIPVIITGRQSSMLLQRCAELAITEIYQNVDNKLEKLAALLKKYTDARTANNSNSIELANNTAAATTTLSQRDEGYTLANVAYIGDDLPDLPCMERVRQAGGLVGCPRDSVPEILALADFISQKVGGDGAVREFIDWLLK